ncbi:hypothetical protein TALC_00881 [Thermoplasmatales archaeon BRNA1]|nr:hypothetical protein TALC_00881 [Thermoplasmatales archaeon BRNA1]
MASALDRSRREKELKRAQKSRVKEESKLQAKIRRANQKEDSEKRRTIRKNSSASREIRHSVITMVYSSLIILVAFFLCEGLLLWHSGNGGDVDVHLLNIADNSLAFIVGLSAMDALTYYNLVGRTKRNEVRAIIRHNRIVEPSIDMFLARKNMLIAQPGDNVDQYRLKSEFTIRNLADMYGPSEIASDAGMSKIDMFEFHQKKLYKAFLNMVEDIDFSFNPVCCDAALKFINATTYGSSALASLQSFDREGNRTKKTTIIRMIKDESMMGDISKTRPELMSVYIIMQMIRDQEEALAEYISAVEEIEENDPDAKRRRNSLY